MILIYLGVGIVYVMMMSFLLMLWNQPPGILSGDGEKPNATVLIPFRNEANNLPNIFDRLIQLDFEYVEIIWIDDHSEDDSITVLEKLIRENKVSMKVIGSEGIGKKAAITAGILASSGEIIITTDADCVMSQDWVNTLIRPFQDPAVHLVAGPVMTFTERSIFSKFQQADWASIQLVTLAGFKNKFPIMCSGANLAYRKASFCEVQGFEGNQEFLSGDDEFILKKMVKKYGSGATLYIKEAECLVKTKPFSNMSDLFQQRYRWASKWKAHESKSHEWAALIPLSVQLVFISSIYLPFLGKVGFLIFIAVWSLKIVTEKRVLGKVLKNYGLKIDTLSWICIGVLHPLYVLVTALGALRGNYIWKGRRNPRII